MPTVSCNRDALFKSLGHVYTEEEFELLCFEFGIELDEVTSEKQMVRKEKNTSISQAELDAIPEEVIYKIDIPANRYDLLCIEGIARGLNVFLQREPLPVFRSINASSPLRMTVAPETAQIRPFVVTAVLRDVEFDLDSYNSFIELQDKLHENICRKRTLVAIGTHDLDTLSPPFTYEALPPDQLKFKPLNQVNEMSGTELMEFYDHDAKIKKFLYIIRDSPVYPIIKDSKGVVLSLPPIINGDHSKISLSTKNIFIECTATDITKANVVLQTVVAMFSEYCGKSTKDSSKKFTVEPGLVIYPDDRHRDGKEVVTPDMSSREMLCSIDYVNSATGIKPPLDGATMCDLLTKMQLTATISPGDATKLLVMVPPTRADVLHECDVMEDVAIAYGYDNIQKTVPSTVTIGKQYPINKLTDLLRLEFAACGFNEVLTFALNSRKENFEALRQVNDGKTAVEIDNPKTIGFEICRTNLLTGLLKTVQSSGKAIPLPLKLFEVTDVVVLDPEVEVDGTRVGAKNIRMGAAVVVNTTDGFEVVHGLADRLMVVFGLLHREDPELVSTPNAYSFEYRAVANPTYFENRAAEILVFPPASSAETEPTSIGDFGVIHPEVMCAFKIDDKGAASAIQINVQYLLGLRPSIESAPLVDAETESAARAARCRAAGVPEDASDEKLAAAEYGTKLPEGHVVTVTQDDLPEEDEDDAATAGSMGDFASAIGGGDDY